MTKTFKHKLKDKIYQLDKDIASLISMFDESNGGGSGGGASSEKQLKYLIQCKISQRDRYINELYIRSSTRSVWLSTTATILSSVAVMLASVSPIIMLLHHKP